MSSDSTEDLDIGCIIKLQKVFTMAIEVVLALLGFMKFATFKGAGEKRELHIPNVGYMPFE